MVITEQRQYIIPTKNNYILRKLLTLNMVGGRERVSHVSRVRVVYLTNDSTTEKIEPSDIFLRKSYQIVVDIKYFLHFMLTISEMDLFNIEIRLDTFISA